MQAEWIESSFLLLKSLSSLSFHLSLQSFSPCIGPFPVTLIPITYIPLLAHVQYTQSHQMSSNTLVQPPAPPLSPTMTISTPPATQTYHEQHQKGKDRYTVIDLEKNDTLNREEIRIHYPDYDEEATIQAHQHDPYRTTTTTSTKTGNEYFHIITRLRRFRRKVSYTYTYIAFGYPGWVFK